MFECCCCFSILLLGGAGAVASISFKLPKPIEIIEKIVMRK